MATSAELQIQLDELKRQEAATRTGPAVTTVESGYTTTEFWGMIVSDIIALGAIFHPGFHAVPGLAQAIAAGAAGIVNAAYAIGRSLRKKNAVT